MNHRYDRYERDRPGRELSLVDVQRLAAIGEGLHIEFKRRVPSARRLAKEIAALANTLGGQLLLGVTDEGDVIGVRDAEEEEFALRQALEKHCTPAITTEVTRVRVSRRRDVILVHVPESEAKPHFVIDEEDPGRRLAYIRIEDMSVEASREAVRLMKAEQNPKDVKFEFGEKELKLMRYLDEYGRITVEQFARLAHVPKRAASRTLVLLARAKILTLHADPKGDYFTLSLHRAA